MARSASPLALALAALGSTFLRRHVSWMAPLQF
jgi:hypothetical protein